LHHGEAAAERVEETLTFGGASHILGMRQASGAAGQRGGVCALVGCDRARDPTDAGLLRRFILGKGFQVGKLGPEGDERREVRLKKSTLAGEQVSTDARLEIDHGSLAGVERLCRLLRATFSLRIAVQRVDAQREDDEYSRDDHQQKADRAENRRAQAAALSCVIHASAGSTHPGTRASTRSLEAPEPAAMRICCIVPSIGTTRERREPSSALTAATRERRAQ